MKNGEVDNTQEALEAEKKKKQNKWGARQKRRSKKKVWQSKSVKEICSGGYVEPSPGRTTGRMKQVGEFVGRGVGGKKARPPLRTCGLFFAGLPGEFHFGAPSVACGR